VAEAIRAQGPVDIVILSEVARGWPLSGGLDLTSWLSRALDMPYVWAPAAGEQFGNAVLSRLPVSRFRVAALTKDGNSMGRSAARVELGLSGGRRLTVVATHLQNRNDPGAVAARRTEVQEVLDLWAGAPLTILAGDLNPAQGPPDYPARVPEDFSELQPLLAAGFTTAADLTGCDRPSSNDNCSDFVFAGTGLEPRTMDVVAVPGFDHRMLVTDIGVPAAG
jgi:endonuclease/exonuclease/phosphatase family metal-dependent hydrolase